MKRRWLIAWGIQIGEMLAVCALQALTRAVHPALYAATLWVGVPICGCLTAYKAVRRGLLNYAAWLAPMPCLFAAHLLIWGFSPSAGAGLLTALLSIVGAAAGEVRNGENKRKKH